MSTLPAAPRPQAVSDMRGLRIPGHTLTLLRDLVLARTGMYYETHRLATLADRLAPLALQRGFDSLLDYYYLLKYDAGADEAWGHVIDALAVQETYFWREFDQVKALTDAIIPRLVGLGRVPIRIWSVPCATGEEPLSLAIALTEAGWFNRAWIEIHAADASQAALDRARAGRFGARAFRQLPDALRDKYFERTNEGKEWRVSPAIHARVTSWSRLNVVQGDQLTALAGAHVVFCRNLFIYFQEGTVRQVVDAFADAMASPGFLCVGAAESLLRLTSRFELNEIDGAYIYAKA